MKKSLTKHQEWKHQVVGMNCVSLTINDLFNLVFKALYCELTWIDGDVRVSVEERLVSFWFVYIMHYAFCKVRRLSEHLALNAVKIKKHFAFHARLAQPVLGVLFVFRVYLLLILLVLEVNDSYRRLAESLIENYHSSLYIKCWQGLEIIYVRFINSSVLLHLPHVFKSNFENGRISC